MHKHLVTFIVAVIIFTATMAHAQSIDPSKWLAMNTKAGLNGQQECYSPANDSLSGGDLVINTVAQNTTCGGQSASYGSGMLASVFTFSGGTVEFSAKMPGGTGPWPAIWLLGADCRPTQATQYNASGCNWPNAGSEEQDITEILNSNHTSVNQQLHLASGSPGCSASAADVSQNFHRYAYAWDAVNGTLTWYIDGVKTCGPIAASITRPAFVIINTAVGGCCGSTPVNSTFPQKMSIDYFRHCKAVSSSCSQANADIDDEFNGATVAPPTAPSFVSAVVN